MVNVVYSSNDITVLGGPSRLDLDLNIGPSGNRGSLIFIGDRNPNQINPATGFSQRPALFDLFINSNPSSSSYLQAYQFVSRDGVSQWIEVFKLTQNIVSLNKVATFTNGEANLTINISELGLEDLPFSVRNNSSLYFNVSATISNINVTLIEDQEDLETSHNPAAISLLVRDVEDDTSGDPIGQEDPETFPLILPIDIKGVEFVDSSWVPINNKSVIIYLTIAFANPNEILSFAGSGD